MRPRALWWCLAVALVASTAAALTSPMGGAVALPRGQTLRLPFPSGSRIRLLSAYSPSGGSSLHDGTNRTLYANDYYALDLVYDGVANNGLGRPVVASFAGTVVRAGWSSEGWANYGQRVILRHDLGDGHVYHTIYCHLNAISVREGQSVTQGQTLGELGRSCMGSLSCSSFGSPHLHWALHQDSTIGGSGTGGSYGGRAVVPEPLDGAENLRQGMVITSTNGGGGSTGPTCGDGRCESGETEASCASDCRRCASIPAGGRVVDDTDACFSRGGNAMYWYPASAGHGGSLWWTHATSSAAVDNYAVWSLTFDRAGEYLVEAYTAADYNGSRRAGYTVTHAGRTDRVVVDQSASSSWNRVGRFAFSGGGSQSVRLDDNTGEPFSERRRLAFDALRITPVTAPPVDAGSPRDVPVVTVDVQSPRDTGVPVLADAGFDVGVAPVDAGSPSDRGMVVRDAGSVRDVPITPDDTGVDETDAGPVIELPDGGNCGCEVPGRPRGRSPLAVALALLAGLVAGRSVSRRSSGRRGPSARG